MDECVELIRDLTGCGYGDLNTLKDKARLYTLISGERLDIYNDFNDGVGTDLNGILHRYMTATIQEIADDLKSPEYSSIENINEIITYLENKAPYKMWCNGIDTYFRIDALDYPENTREEIIKEIISEITEKLEDGGS